MPSTKWVKGQSGNPKGRPPTGHALAEYIRASIEPAELVRIAIDIARNDSLEPKDRLAAVKWVGSSGWSAPVVEMDIGSDISPEQVALLGAMMLTPHERRQRIAAIEADADDEGQLPIEGADEHDA